MRSQAKNFVSYLEKSNARPSWLHHCRLLAAGGSVPRMATPPRTQCKIQEKKTQQLKEEDARFGQLVTCDAFCRTGGGAVAHGLLSLRARTCPTAMRSRQSCTGSHAPRHHTRTQRHGEGGKQRRFLSRVVLGLLQFS